MALTKLVVLSAKYPSPLLQFVQSNPRTAPVLWSWSTFKKVHLPTMVLVLQMAQQFSCFARSSLYCEIVKLYFDKSLPRRAPPFSWNRKVASFIFSGLFLPHITAGESLHLSQQVDITELLLPFKLKVISGGVLKHFLHLIMEPLYDAKW